MPIYEYKCPQCGELIELLRLIHSREDPIDCYKCGAAAQRILSTFNTFGKASASGSLESLEQPERIRAPQTSGVAIRLEGSATVEGCSFKNYRVGISVARGTDLKMRDNKFVNVGSPVEVTLE